ncbi:MAG: hypothetical protein KDC07_10210 [Chitinophagaceae bacterium]|nr:hypothetical protein [Chitinophagaceae bacterium]MCB9044634.1 hypothetical protein [Chitinophagales bacterium]
MPKHLLLYIILFVTVLPARAQVTGKDSADFAQLSAELNSVKAERVLLRSIHITGNKKTRRSIILREMNVSEGDSVIKDELPSILELNRKRIFNLSIFIEVQVHADSISPGIIDLRIAVKEQWYTMPEVTFKLADRNFNVWWVEHNKDIRRANIGLSLKNRNFRGNLENAGIIAQVGYTQKFGLEYSRPYVDKSQQHGFGVKLFTSRNEEWYFKTDSNKWVFVKTPGSYITNAFEASANYTYRPAYASRHLLELRFRSQAIKDTVLTENAGYFLNGSTHQQLIEFLYRYDLNMVDNWNYPTKGLKAVVHSIARVGWVGFDFQNQYMAEIAYFRKWHNKLYTSHIFRGRLSFPEKQPYTYVYAMGVGSEYLRGYEYYVIDGSHYGLLRTNLKYELINHVIRKIPIRYIATIPVRVYPKIFTDVGYVRNKFGGNSYLNNRPLYSWGAGIDIVSIYDFKFRIEYAWNHLGEKGLFLHINNSE